MRLAWTINNLLKPAAPVRVPRITEDRWYDYEEDTALIVNAVARAIESLGVTRDLAGFKYLVAAVAMQSGSHEPPNVKEIYEVIAEHFYTTPSAVEKAMRYAIESAWTKGDMNRQQEAFGFSVDEERGKPTNAEFIARLAIGVGV